MGSLLLPRSELGTATGDLGEKNGKQFLKRYSHNRHKFLTEVRFTEHCNNGLQGGWKCLLGGSGTRSVPSRIKSPALFPRNALGCAGLGIAYMSKIDVRLLKCTRSPCRLCSSLSPGHPSHLFTGFSLRNLGF